jgi:RNA polymerase sigma-70 factor (ECF subfamily)
MGRYDAQKGFGANGLKAHFLNERPMLLRLLRARLGSIDDAEEILQDMWLKLDYATSGPIAEPGAYLFRIANNLALDRRRAALARLRRESDWNDIHVTDSHAPSAEWTVIHSQRLAQVDAVLNRLPERTARIFRDYRYEGLARKRIGDTLGISVSAVKKHLQRAYRAIHGIDPAETAADHDDPKAMTDDR